MNHFRHLFLLTLTAFIFSSCGSGGNNQNNSSNQNSNNGISFSIGGDDWFAEGYGQYSEIDGKKLVSLFGTNTEKGMDQFGIKIHNFSGIGEYKVLSGNSGNFVLTFSRMNKETRQTKFYQVADEQAMVKVTALDANLSTISGEFSFKVKDQENNITSIENGKFTNLRLVQVQ